MIKVPFSRMKLMSRALMPLHRGAEARCICRRLKSSRQHGEVVRKAQVISHSFQITRSATNNLRIAFQCHVDNPSRKVETS
ncbi:hypothetical protein TNCV_4311791 [Trichonephila clavipes]|nr:hypothetical protein TNCV_4311791 [Trichonephila clavipes]